MEKDIEMSIVDTIIEKPTGFNIENRHFNIYPPTLGKTYLLARLFRNLNADQQMIQSDPYTEALSLCESQKDIVCRVLAYYTFQSKEELFNNSEIENRTKLFSEKLETGELATLFVLILLGDNTDEYITYLGIDKEREERRRISEVKNDSSSLTFGGNSTYGTMIDFACQRYGWSMEYVVWGISYANLKMLIADFVTTVYLSDEERKKLHIFDDKEYINADDPKNKDLIRSMISE